MGRPSSRKDRRQRQNEDYPPVALRSRYSGHAAAVWHQCDILLLPTVLIKSVGLDNKLARLLAACNSVSYSVSYLLFSLVGIPNVENWRRKKMMFAASGQSFCYLIITVLLRYSEKPGYARDQSHCEDP